MGSKSVGIILAAGSGKRMKSNIAKQYLLVHDKPVLYYSLKAFEDSEIDEMVLVLSEDMEDYCRKNILELYQFNKITGIIYGGKERYDSVYNALKSIKDCGYVLVHDGARPCIQVETINRMLKEVQVSQACVIGVPTKDTIKIVNDDNIVIETPNRERVWNVQTPQAFQFDLLKKAHENLRLQKDIRVTDDAMVVETMLNVPVKMVEGDYSNIKVTTPEDLEIVKGFLM